MVTVQQFKSRSVRAQCSTNSSFWHSCNLVQMQRSNKTDLYDVLIQKL